ncbi:uncharacterized protein LOC135829831 [Sycon ciliatum]|uniref:uncharacterized protein LOC135829831 n=1 Tax=Sycon ciliatum TaxID=27933 RepID=UPI0031F6B4EB
MADRSPAPGSPGRNREAVDGLKQNVIKRAPYFIPAGFAALIWAYVVGAFGLSLLWLVVPVVVMWLVLREQYLALIENLVYEVSTRVFRQRAFRKAESAEWANILLNRWWACSSESLFDTFTSSLNPLLHDFKPSIIDTIELTEVQLGGHTPFVKDVSILEVASAMGGAAEVQVLTPENSQVQPSNLSQLPCRHQVILNATIGFAAPNAQLTFKTKVKTVGAVLAIQLENFHFNAHTQLVLTIDSEAPFPHFTNLSFTFLSKPDVWLNIRVLKGLQIMQLPIIKNWLHSLIMDSLKETLVDPYRYSVDITNKENDSMVGKGDQASGVLTVVLENHGLATNDNISCWCSVRVGDQKYKTAVCSSKQAWKTAYSFLCNDPAEESLVLKVMTRKMMRKSTLLEHPTNLSTLAPRPARPASRASEGKRRSYSAGSGSTSDAGSFAAGAAGLENLETVSRHHNFTYRGGQLDMDISYSPLKPISLSADTAMSPSPAPQTPSDSECFSGVMYVCMHSAANLLAMDDDGTSDPYCVLMLNRRKVFTSNFQVNTLDPVWEQGVEFFTADYRKACLTFLLYDWDGRVSGDDFLGLTTLTLEQGEFSVVRRVMNLRLHRHESKSSTQEESESVLAEERSASPTTPEAPGRFSSALGRLKSLTEIGHRRQLKSGSSSLDMSPGCVTISVVFRPVKSVALSETTMKVVPTADEVADLALQGGLNIARLEGGGAGDAASVPNRVEYGLASPGVIHIIIHRARDLMSKDINGKSDPYCIVKVGKAVRYKTRVIPKTLHPQWEESFTIEYLKDDEKLTIVCFDKDTLSDDALGTIQLDMDMITSCSTGPSWFSLQNVAHGKVQLSFNVEQSVGPVSTSSDDSHSPSPIAASSSAPSHCPSSISSVSAMSHVDSGSNILQAAVAAAAAGTSVTATPDADSADQHGASKTAVTAGAAAGDSVVSSSSVSSKTRSGKLRSGAGHHRSRSMDNGSKSPGPAAAAAGSRLSGEQHTPASKQLSGSYDGVNLKSGSEINSTHSVNSNVSDPDVSATSTETAADGNGVRQRRLSRQSTATQGSAPFSPLSNRSQLFYLSGTVIRADGLKGEADSLELYVKIRLNTRSFFERPQPFSRGPEIYKSRRVKGTLTPEWRETFQVEEASVSSDSLLTIDLKSSSKTTIGTQTIVLEKFMEGLTQKTKWLNMGNGARVELSLACQHAPPSPNGTSASSSSQSSSVKRSGSFFRRQKNQ